MNNKLSVLALAFALAALPGLGQTAPGAGHKLAGFRYFLEHWADDGTAVTATDRRAAHQLQFAIGESDMTVVKTLTGIYSAKVRALTAETRGIVGSNGRSSAIESRVMEARSRYDAVILEFGEKLLQQASPQFRERLLKRLFP